MHSLAANWFNVIQTLVLVATLTVAISALRSSERATKGSNRLAIVANNRQIWGQLTTNYRLQSVMRPTMEPSGHVTESEFNFINQCIGQAAIVFDLVQMGGIGPIEGARRDIHDTFNLPAFKAVWEINKPYRDVAFVEYIESCLAGVDLDKPLAKRPNLMQSTVKNFLQKLPTMHFR
jgi:hypothetical protein